MAFSTETYTIQGMKQDTSELLADKNFAFENFNIRLLVDNTTTNLVATQEKGNEQVKQILITESFFSTETESTVQYTDVDFTTFDTFPFMTIGHCEIDKYLVLFGKVISDFQQGGISFTEGNDIVLRLELINNTFYGWLIYNSNELNFDVNWPLETIGNVETNLIKKVYFIDGINIPRAVNIIAENAGILANINLGFSLQLKDKFTVTKDHSVFGNYPMGKVRFFYTYFNDNNSETNIVDWSPFFDCNFDHQGGVVDSQHKTTFAFRIKIENPDDQFKFVRIYMQHFTTADPNVYTMKYVERPIFSNTEISYLFRYDELDAKNATETYLDKKIVNATFIPYTFAEKGNRMFYGNIKQKTPQIENIDFTDCTNVQFYQKTIGFEDLTINRVYQYDPEDTTFNGSNFDYMGFRRGNWYRFGLIAQYSTGEWSNVMFICDKQCDVNSETEISYSVMDQQYHSLGSYPEKSIYKIPSAKLKVTNKAKFVNCLEKLYKLGYKRIKPVCVVPPYNYRTVLTQGLSCPTIYHGGGRSSNINGLFAMPSYFFRPQPLYPKETVISVDGKKVFRPDHEYTIRSIDDLKNDKNILDGNGDWLLNPKFDNEQYCTYNSIFREYRHGFSLPPKDRIDAELQSSDIAINDYYYQYNVDNKMVDSKLFNLGGYNLGQWLYDMTYIDNDWLMLFKPVVPTNMGVYPTHDLWTSGYENTVFVDESINTLNSPEIDYCFSDQVEPWYKNQNIVTVGFAQITNSQTNISIADKKFEQDPSLEPDLISNDSEYLISSGKCLFDLIKNPGSPYNLDDDLVDFVKRLRTRPKIQNQPLSIMNGPWWLDTMLVNTFVHANFGSKEAVEIGKFLILIAFAGLEDFYNVIKSGYKDTDKLDIFETDYGITDAKDNEINFGDISNFVINSNSILSHKKAGKAFLFVRGINQLLQNPSYKWTTSYYGETNKRDTTKEKWVVKRKDGSIFYIDWLQKINPAYFVDFINQNWEDFLENMHFADLVTTDYELLRSLYSLSVLGTTLSTLRFANFTMTDDAFWNNYYKYRTSYETDTNANVFGRLESLPKYNNTNKKLNKIYSDWYYSDVNTQHLHNFNGDLRGTFSYYFFPYNKHNNSDITFYKNHGKINDEPFNDVVITHPWLLPSANITDYKFVNNSLPNVNHYTELEQFENKIGYFNGSKFGCHYYAPFSTNFIGAVFDPFYAHVTYPFMSDNTDTPFCGSHDVYRKGHDGNVRPAYNSTNSNLYSNCTNYIDYRKAPEYKTYSAYYHAPRLTQEYRAEPDLSDIPFLENSNVTKLYSYDCSDSASTPFVPTLTHRTYTLTAAMKWYRGFKRISSSDSGWSTNWVCNGNHLTKPSVMGDLLFSGYLPQLFTKNGLVTNFVPDTLFNINKVAQVESGPDNSGKIGEFTFKMRDFLSNNELQTISLRYNPMPHIVYYNNSDSSDTLLLTDKFYTTNSEPHKVVVNIADSFEPQFYYKEFVNHYNFVDLNTGAAVPWHVKIANNWNKSIYPHTGTWVQYDFNYLKKAENKQPYWNKNGILGSYPSTIAQHNLFVPLKKFIARDSNGKLRDKNNYWLLSVCNLENTQLIERCESENKNPYTIDNISKEFWDWKMCGNVVELSDVLNATTLQDAENLVKFLEGDTYFQRYNCFKTVSSDAKNGLVWDNSGNVTAPEVGANDVTETASVMLESYLNLDGLCWEYNTTIDSEYSPLVHPFYANAAQINRVYSIQNNLCDTFKQIDTNYENSKLTHYPTKILWSAQKIEGEVIDSWGVVPQTNSLLVSGEMGSINKFVAYNNNIFSLQDHGLSILNYDAQVVRPTDTASTLSIYLSDGSKLQGVTYASRTIGTTNKWSVVVGNNGFYWVDETLQKIYSYGQRDESVGINDLTLSCGMQSWANDHFNVTNGVWNPVLFTDGRTALKANVDLKNGDVYWMDGYNCLCFNENIRLFTSFYSYETTPYKFNYLDKIYSVMNFESGSSLFSDQVNYNHVFYNTIRNSYIDLLVNPNGLYDKVFNFIEYNIESYLPNGELFAGHNAYSDIEVFNMYQRGSETFTPINTKEKFRLWRTTLPRDGVNKMNRIRGPWCRIKLIDDPKKLHVNSKQPDSFFDKLYYINVNYTIPEQPLKTNIQNNKD